MLKEILHLWKKEGIYMAKKENYNEMLNNLEDILSNIRKR